MARWYQTSGDAKWTRTRVQCYSGYLDGEEEPRSFEAGSLQLDVVEIIDRWVTPTHRHFKVRARNRALYILRYENAGGRWELTSLAVRR